MSDSIGSVCCKEECEGTEYSCACQKCEKEKFKQQDPPKEFEVTFVRRFKDILA